jgi:hypothetical protein
LRNIIWRDTTYDGSKIRICKTYIRLILTYARKREPKYSKRILGILGIAEIMTLSAIRGVSLGGIEQIR